MLATLLRQTIITSSSQHLATPNERKRHRSRSNCLVIEVETFKFSRRLHYCGDCLIYSTTLRKHRKRANAISSGYPLHLPCLLKWTTCMTLSCAPALTSLIQPYLLTFVGLDRDANVRFVSQALTMTKRTRMVLCCPWSLRSVKMGSGSLGMSSSSGNITPALSSHL